MSLLTFNEELHQYRWKDVVVPSVTQVIEPAYDFRFVKFEDLERARQKGKAVHATVTLAETGRLDEESTSSVLLKYLAQWRQFRKEMLYAPDDMGTTMFSTTFGFAGTDDTFGHIAGEPIIIDVKTGAKHAAHALQTAGYHELRLGLGMIPKNTKRASLYLSESGYTYSPHNDPYDRSVFLGMLTYNKWKKHHE